MDVTAQNTDKTVSDLDAHGLGEPLDDGEEGEGGEQGGLVAVSVHDLTEGAVGGGQPSVLQLEILNQDFVQSIEVDFN